MPRFTLTREEALIDAEIYADAWKRLSSTSRLTLTREEIPIRRSVDNKDVA